MKRQHWYHEECVPASGVRTSESPMHELCAACGREGQCVHVEIGRVIPVFIGTVPEPEVRYREAEECVICDEKVSEDAVSQREEEQVTVKEEERNETLSELAQLKAAIARLERHEKENSTA